MNRAPLLGLCLCDGPEANAYKSGEWTQILDARVGRFRNRLESDVKSGGVGGVVRRGVPMATFLAGFPSFGCVPGVVGVSADLMPQTSNLLGLLDRQGMVSPGDMSAIPPKLRGADGILILTNDRLVGLKDLLSQFLDGRTEAGWVSPASLDAQAARQLQSMIDGAIAAKSDAFIRRISHVKDHIALDGGAIRMGALQAALASKDTQFFVDSWVDDERLRLMRRATENGHSCAATVALALATEGHALTYSEPWSVVAFLYLCDSTPLGFDPWGNQEQNHSLVELSEERVLLLRDVAKRVRHTDIDGVALGRVAASTGLNPGEVSQFLEKGIHVLRDAVAPDIQGLIESRARKRRAVFACACVM